MTVPEWRTTVTGLLTRKAFGSAVRSRLLVWISVWNRPISVTRPKCVPVRTKSPVRKLFMMRSIRPAMAFEATVVEDMAMIAVSSRPSRLSRWPFVSSPTGRARIASTTPTPTRAITVTWRGSLLFAITPSRSKSRRFTPQTTSTVPRPMTSSGTRRGSSSSSPFMASMSVSSRAAAWRCRNSLRCYLKGGVIPRVFAH